MTDDELATRLCEHWMKSPDRRQRSVAVDEIAAFMSGVKAVLSIPAIRAAASPSAFEAISAALIERDTR